MQFRLTIDTTRFASFQIPGGLNFWYNKYQADFELPIGQERQVCVDDLIEQLEKIKFVPYQNLADFEDRIPVAEGGHKALVDALKNHDCEMPVDVSARTQVGDDVLVFVLEEVDYV